MARNKQKQEGSGELTSSMTGLTGRRSMLKALGGSSVAMLTGCIGGGGGGDRPITIGALEPLSGNFAPWGAAHSAGLQFAVDEVNADGGVLGRDVNIVESDTQSNPGEADSIFRRFVDQDDAVAVRGPASCTSESWRSSKSLTDIRTVVPRAGIKANGPQTALTVP